MDAVTTLLADLREGRPPAVRFDSRRAGVHEIGNPNVDPARRRHHGKRTGRADEQGCGLRCGVVGYGVLHRARGRRQRRHDLGAARGRVRHDRQRENPDYLPGIELPPVITATHDRSSPRPAPSSWCSPSPSQKLRENLTQWADLIPRDAVLVSLMKGVELGTLKRMSE